MMLGGCWVFDLERYAQFLPKEQGAVVIEANELALKRSCVPDRIRMPPKNAVHPMSSKIDHQANRKISTVTKEV